MGTTSPLTQEQQRRVRERLLAERQQARRDLADAQQRLRAAAREAERAVAREQADWAAYEPHDGQPGHLSHPAYTRWAVSHADHARAAQAHLLAHDRVAQLQARVAHLYAPGTLDERLQVRAANEQKFAGMGAA
jgi:hypothetical protein